MWGFIGMATSIIVFVGVLIMIWVNERQRKRLEWYHEFTTKQSDVIASYQTALAMREKNIELLASMLEERGVDIGFTRHTVQ